jgi:hypothetical protein
MAGYWGRAFDRFNGHWGYSQWAVWPPFYHVILASVFHIFSLLRLPNSHWLAAILLLQCLLGSISVYALYCTCKVVLKDKRFAYLSAVLYAITYPIVYFNAFVISENVAIPLLIIATAIVLRSPSNVRRLSLGGIILAIAVGSRPAYLPFIVPFALYAWFAGGDPRTRLRSLAVIVGFVATIGLISTDNYIVSQGRLKGLSSNGGINFCIAQCKIFKIHSDSIFDGGHYVCEIVHPQFSGEPWRGTFITSEPMSNQAFFYHKGLACLKDPETWWDDFTQLSKLFFGPVFPTFFSAKGYAQLMPICNWVLGLLALASIFLPPIQWAINKRSFSMEIGLLWSYLPLTVVLCYFYGSERRFLYSEIFVVYPLLFSVALGVAKVIRRPQSVQH